jgi:hypothetical protein
VFTSVLHSLVEAFRREPHVRIGKEQPVAPRFRDPDSVILT